MADQYCVIGTDVSHSPSPAMMNAAFRASGIAAAYGRVNVGEDRFEREFSLLMSRGFKGMNVTIPFKTTVIPMLAGLDRVATRIQAVNTVKREAKEEKKEEKKKNRGTDGEEEMDEDSGREGRGWRYLGHNTDPDGIVEPLKKLIGGTDRASMKSEVGSTLDFRNALLIGAGGAARAFCEAMNRVGCVDLAIAVRDVERARSFAQDMERAFPRMNLTLAPMNDLRHLNHDLVFNASPMGTKHEPLPEELARILPGTKIVFDAVYSPRETMLLVEAARNGSAVIHGEEMLLHQGMAAFELWTGVEAPERVMRDALIESLRGSAEGRRVHGEKKKSVAGTEGDGLMSQDR
jgi:shikimate dehydrogenase